MHDFQSCLLTFIDGVLKIFDHNTLEIIQEIYTGFGRRKIMSLDLATVGDQLMLAVGLSNGFVHIGAICSDGRNVVKSGTGGTSL